MLTCNRNKGLCQLYNIVVTAIIVKDGRVLITKRSADKKKWPNKWTLPGGNLEDSDFIGTPTPINNQWYGALENCVRREVKEEVGLEVSDIQYLCNIAIPGCVIISYTAAWKSGTVELQESECSEYAWVAPEDLDDYDLIDGIADEIRQIYV